MAANFWLSSHYKYWMLTKEELIVATGRQDDLRCLSAEEYQKIHILFANFIQALGEHLKHRQQVIATATIYFKRFYSKNSLKNVDPLLLAPTCLYLASKVEECGVISNTRLIQTCANVVKNKFMSVFNCEYPYRINQVYECEFFVLETMNCCLILYHPYRTLVQYVKDMNEDDSFLSLAWRIVNDSLRTDVCLIYHPYQVALAAVYMACVVRQKDCSEWFKELCVDMEKILAITQEVLKLYEILKTYDEKRDMQAILAKAPKPKTTSRPSSSASSNSQYLSHSPVVSSQTGTPR